MAFQLKYYLEFRTLKIGNTDLHRVELWQNTATILVAEEIKGAQSPITIEMPDLSHKFQVVRGRGATLNLLSNTDMKFFAGLEHIDPQEFKVIYKVAGVTKWVGYLNSDFQSEPYDIDFNYIITTTATDGFSLMDRFRFLQSDETKYTGLKSKWELLQICLNKVGLTYTDIRVKLATTFTGQTLARLSTPVNAAFTAGTGTLAIGTYYYRVSAINAVGETLASTETSLALGAIGGVNVNWGAVSGATGYKVYGRTTGAELLIATVGAVTTYLDNGSITPSGALPTSNTTAADLSILHESFVNCANFYDEDGLAMTMREVIESILAPYGAFICQDNGSIYITDIHTMAGGGSVSFQRFNASTYAYISTTAETIEKTVTSIGYFGTGHGIERSGGTNMQRVVYSPYPQKKLIEQTLVTPDEFTAVPATFSDKDGYKYRTLSGHNLFTTGSPADFEESCYAEASEHFIYARFPMITNNIPLMQLTTPTAQHLSISDAQLNGNPILFSLNKRFQNGAALKITGKILAKTKANPYDSNYSGPELTAKAERLTELQTQIVINIGDFYYDKSLDAFTTTFYSGNYFKTTKQDFAYISNQWVDIGEYGEGIIIPIRDSSILDIYTIIHGNFNIIFYSNTKVRIQGEDLLTNNSVLDEVWIRDLKIEIVNIDGSDIEDIDAEYIGKLNKLFAKEGEEINLTCGSMVQFSDNGKIMRPNGDTYADMIGWTRAAQSFKIEELLLNSLCSNYRENYVTLTGMKLKNEFSMMNVLTDSAYLGTKKLMVKSSVIDPANYVNEVTLVEISPDELTIVKE